MWDSGLHHGNGDMNWEVLIVRFLECQCMSMSQYVATLYKYFYPSLDILHKQGSTAFPFFGILKKQKAKQDLRFIEGIILFH